jgi:hypothetical protein
MSSRVAVVAALAMLTMSSHAQGQAATVSGAFTLGGKALKPAHAAAFRIRDQNAPRTLETYVMLTLAPVDVRAISADVDPYTVAINDPAVMRADYIALQVRASGETRLNAHVGGTQYIDSSGSIMGQAGSLVATCTENTTARIACMVKTAKPVKPMDGAEWTIDVTFATPVSSRPAGKPLPADGGPAGKALLELTTAAGGKTLAPILALLTPERAKSFKEDWRTPEQNLESAKELLGFRLPKQPKITGGEQVGDDRVVLEVEGVPYPNGLMLYLVEMRLIDGRWRYDDASPVGILR